MLFPSPETASSPRVWATHFTLHFIHSNLQWKTGPPCVYFHPFTHFQTKLSLLDLQGEGLRAIIFHFNSIWAKFSWLWDGLGHKVPWILPWRRHWQQKGQGIWRCPTQNDGVWAKPEELGRKWSSLLGQGEMELIISFSAFSHSHLKWKTFLFSYLGLGWQSGATGLSLTASTQGLKSSSHAIPALMESNCPHARGKATPLLLSMRCLAGQSWCGNGYPARFNSLLLVMLLQWYINFMLKWIIINW